MVPGGGVALLRALPVLASVETANKDEKIGVDVINRAIRSVAIISAGVLYLGKTLSPKRDIARS